LISQIKRAVVSVPSNIAEGVGRNYKKDTVQFLHISRGSLYELETLIEIGEMLEMSDTVKTKGIAGLIDRCKQMINGLIRRYEGDNELK
jgi:four helix bundle protein